MENKDRIYENLTLTMITNKNSIGHIQFYLVGLVPAEVIWESGVRERIEIAGRIPVEPFSEGKTLMGRRIARKHFEKQLKGEYATSLVEEIMGGFSKALETKELQGKKFSMLALV